MLDGALMNGIVKDPSKLLCIDIESSFNDVSNYYSMFTISSQTRISLKDFGVLITATISSISIYDLSLK